MLPKLTLVLGGAASGKSIFAESLVLNSGLHPIYLATSRIWDEEMRNKVDKHVKQRGPGWITHEAPLDLERALSTVNETEAVLLDCATMWLSNHMMDETDLPAAEDALLTALSTCASPVVIVSNEVGHGIVPDNALARSFRQAQGELNQKLAAASDCTVQVVAGLPQVLKGSLG